MQEPRCPASQNGPGCPGPVTSFYQDLSQYLKSINPNQLVRNRPSPVPCCSSVRIQLLTSASVHCLHVASHVWGAYQSQRCHQLQVAGEDDIQSSLPCVGMVCCWQLLLLLAYCNERLWHADNARGGGFLCYWIWA